MSAAANNDLITRFYSAFTERDGLTMSACYAPDAHFSDPVFSNLNGAEPGAMWRMLTSRGKDLEVELVEHDATENTGHARWIANYTFTQTDRHVVNDVRANFKFEHGLIMDHLDDFNFHKWSRQALGVSGLLLGWTPIIRGTVQKRARDGLDKFIAAESAV